jgi:hypothetical protein
LFDLLLEPTAAFEVARQRPDALGGGHAFLLEIACEGLE